MTSHLSKLIEFELQRVTGDIRLRTQDNSLESFVFVYSIGGNRGNPHFGKWRSPYDALLVLEKLKDWNGCESDWIKLGIPVFE